MGRILPHFLGGPSGGSPGGSGEIRYNQGMRPPSGFGRRFSAGARLLLAGLLLGGSPVRGESLLARSPGPRRPGTPSYRGYRIARIHIIRRRIFDTSVPSENKSVYRGINALHISTTERTIHQQLLFEEGDLYDPALARESERALRGILRLRDVSVVPVPVGNGRVDVMVESQETWSTQPSASASGTGSDLKYRFGLREKNLFGLGKDLNFVYKKAAGRVSRSVGYDDPALLGTRWRLGGFYEDTTDGSARSLRVERPFFSSVTPFALRTAGGYTRTETPIYVAGQEVNRLGKENREFFAGPAVSLWSTTKRIRRLGVEYGYRHNKLFDTKPVRSLREDKVYHSVGPTIQWDRENFITVDHVRTYDREEDINLGPTLTVNVGFARSNWFRESGDATFAKADAGRGAALGPGAFALATVSGEGQREDGVWKNTRTRWAVEYNNHFSRAQTLTARATWEQVLRPGDETQLLLGGDTGLRGYPLNEFAGNRLFSAIVEDRLFFFPDVLHLFGLGGVIFADSGYAWPRGAAVRFRDLRADVGVGLRFHISRASLGHVIRLDVARPLRPIEGERYWLVTFGTSQVF